MKREEKVSSGRIFKKRKQTSLLPSNYSDGYCNTIANNNSK